MHTPQGKIGNTLFKTSTHQNFNNFKKINVCPSNNNEKFVFTEKQNSKTDVTGFKLWMTL